MTLVRAGLVLLALAAISYLAFAFWWGGTAGAGRVIAGQFWLGFDGRPIAQVSQTVWTISLWHGRVVLALVLWCVTLGLVLAARGLWRGR